MKKCFALVLTLILALSLTSCGNSSNADSSAPVSENAAPESQEPVSSSAPTLSIGEQTAITLTIGDMVLDAYLNDTAPAQSLLAQLPLTVTLNDSDNDFCGDSLDIAYTESDIQSGYQNGDLAFWPPASNFVIFVSGGEHSESTGSLVILGHITSSQEALDALEGRIDVTIERAD